MPRIFKLAIARMHEPGLVPTPALEQALHTLFIANDRTGVHPHGDAVLQFWQQATDGQLQFDITLLPWTEVAFGPTDAMGGATPGISRATQLAKCMAALAARPDPPDIPSYEGLAILLFPGVGVMVPDPNNPGAQLLARFDGGGVGNVIRTAMLPVGIPSHTHSFLTHELGHVLGLPDSQGIWRWTPTPTPEDPLAGYWSGGYGDPLEIMSAQGWPGGDPTRAGDPFPGWPQPAVHTSMGPAPSLALLHWWDPQMLPPGAVQEVFVADGQTPRIRLNAAYGRFGDARLLVVHPGEQGQLQNAQGLGRLYLEFRDRRGWDAGIDDASDVLARSGVVAHAIVPLAGHAPQVAYRGQIQVPLDEDTDLQVGGTPFTVRITSDRSANGWLMVQVSRGGHEHFDVDAEVSVVETRGNGPHEGVRRSPCGDLLRWGTWETRTDGHYAPRSWGFGGEGTLRFGDAPRPGLLPKADPLAVEIRWTVGTVVAPPGDGWLHGCATPQGPVTLAYRIDPHTQALTLGSAFGQAVDKVVVRADLVDHVRGRTLTRFRSFEARGSYRGYPPADLAKLARCGARLASELKLKPSVFRLPDLRGPRPNWAAPKWFERFDTATAGLAVGDPGLRTAMQQFREAVEAMNVPR